MFNFKIFIFNLFLIYKIKTEYKIFKLSQKNFKLNKKIYD